MAKKSSEVLEVGRILVPRALEDRRESHRTSQYAVVQRVPDKENTYRDSEFTFRFVSRAVAEG